MGRVTKSLLFLSGLLVVIQFIQPERNISIQAYPADISRTYPVPEKVQGILKTSCYDCHSNNTRYPWYANIQPGGWWLAWHIREGKQELNFNEFGKYSSRRQQSKLKAITGSIEDGTMPISSYTLIHRNARLTKAEQDLILDWIEKTKDSLLKN
ncbi:MULTISPECIES: heme-binding domain-containing protein [Pedobacter]|uniref:Haem-binding domain-containing protein n=1 Tax=Pedobacter westerhofensis TaxID=425512 RepID=A0A521DRZ6_9SPHI|nr:MULTISPECIES: heme-binding domain-containing protein [Pedobacter]KQR68337.1 cytochrome C [Pedobacter sp. Leaf176]SMO74523.1 Haem-binding domain-containing protein [Pedobacter westerhofensis]